MRRLAPSQPVRRLPRSADQPSSTRSARFAWRTQPPGLRGVVEDTPTAREPREGLADGGGLLLVPPRKVLREEEPRAWGELAWPRRLRYEASLFWEVVSDVRDRVACEMAHDPHDSRLSQCAEVVGMLDSVRRISHCGLSLSLDDFLRQQAADGMVKQKAGVPESLKSRLGDQPFAMKPVQKGLTDHDVIPWRIRVEVLGWRQRAGSGRIPRVLADDQAPQGARKPIARDVVSVPWMLGSTTAGKQWPGPPSDEYPPKRNCAQGPEREMLRGVTPAVLYQATPRHTAAHANAFRCKGRGRPFRRPFYRSFYRPFRYL